ncbi:MAG: FAD-dependent oxidoreductase [Candidatus Azambacteria bacterium]|nr:FAD-dependent oxidoreductase [Candidatus Azambacteria bacterium]
MYDVIIIGGGPAGAAAGVYSARKKLKTLIIADSFGGQSLVSDSIENWIGVKKMTGLELAEMLEEHVRAQENVEIKMPEKAVSVKEISGGLPAQAGWEISTDRNNVYQAKALIVASGGRRRHLNILGEDKFEGKGVSYCSTCDAPVFKNKSVAVIGGGDAGLEAVIDLMPYASKIYLISNKELLTGDSSTQEEIKKSDKVSVIMNADAQEILGDKFISGLKYLDKNDNQIRELKVEGIFVEIGSVPNSEFVKDLVSTNQKGEIVINHKTGATSRPGIFAAGDVTDEIYKQNNISAGDAVAAALSAYNYLFNIKKQ